MQRHHRQRLFVLLVVAMGLIGIVLSARAFTAVEHPGVLIAALVAGALAQALPATVRPQVILSLVNIVLFAAIILGGPDLAVVAVVGATAVGWRWYARPVGRRIVFNLGQFALAATAAGYAYEALAPAGAQRMSHLTQASALASETGLVAPMGLVALVLAGAVFTVINFGLVAAAVSLNLGERYFDALRSTTTALLLQPLYLALSLLAVVLVVDVHIAAVALLVVPAFVARIGLVALEREADAYDNLVLSLVKLIEVKDGYTRGHAERVALLAVELASELGYDFEQRRTARYAALLHDVGKIAVPLHILRKPGTLSAEEYVRVKTHPEVGVDVLQDIGFLEDARPGILHHHERVDGRGYPGGLRGDQIPELARIITVVDAFDAMTSTRAYRRALDVDTAVARIRAGSGTQFDPRVVEAFERVLGRIDWVPTSVSQIDLTGAEPSAPVALSSPVSP